MNFKKNLGLISVISAVALLLALVLYFTKKAGVLDPQGVIADKEQDLIITASWLMLLVVIPVFALSFFVIMKYRASNDKVKYEPTWDSSRLIEIIWWGVPCLIIVTLGVITWKSTHELDPFKPIDSDKKPLTIQVVALQWKWLFLYPEEKIATVNYIQFPEKTPLIFDITADAPMNSFWIPQLGGQVYAMPGMKCKLHLMADRVGRFRGASANLSGTGFAGMTFTAKATSDEEFSSWVETARSSGNTLTKESYPTLVAPTENNPVSLYKLQAEGLFDDILMKYMRPMHHSAATSKQSLSQETACSEDSR